MINQITNHGFTLHKIDVEKNVNKISIYNQVLFMELIMPEIANGKFYSSLSLQSCVMSYNLT